MFDFDCIKLEYPNIYLIFVRFKLTVLPSAKLGPSNC